VTRVSSQSLLALPGIGVAMLPKLLCPLCWPAYATVVSSLGLGFLVGTTYMLPITTSFLGLTLWVLAFRARLRRGLPPFLLGLVASAAVLIGKFYLESNPVMYSGVGLLVAASVWNGWPRRMNRAGCEKCAGQGAQQGSYEHGDKTED
jgi:mercuric ion transport protein